MISKKWIKAIFFTAVVSTTVAYNSCGATSFKEVQDIVLGNPKNPITSELLYAMCSVLNRCSAQVPFDVCVSGVQSTSGIGQTLGLPAGTYDPYSNLMVAEQNRTILSNTSNATTCSTTINNLACANPGVQAAYDPKSANPFANVPQMIPTQTCSNVFIPNTPPVWTNPQPAGPPPYLWAPKTIFHSARKTVILYGGAINASNPYSNGYDGMWEYNPVASTWTQICGPCAPGKRVGHALVYDSTRNKVVLFGGGGGNNSYLNDVWEWDGTNWSNVTTSIGGTAPSARREVYAAYDSSRNRAVVFGGNDSVGTKNEVFEYDGTKWYGPFVPTANPGPRSDPAAGVAYDPIHGRTLIYGALNPGITDDVWGWNGTDWNGGPLCQNCTGTARTGAFVAFDSIRNKLVVVQGYNGIVLSGGTELDGTTFAAMAVSAGGPNPIRDSGASTYDSNRGKIVEFGGNNTATPTLNLNDLWEYGP